MLTIQLNKVPLNEFTKSCQEIHYFKSIKKDIYLSIVKFNNDNYWGRWEAYSNDRFFEDILIDDSLQGILNQLKKHNINAIINDSEIEIL